MSKAKDILMIILCVILVITLIGFIAIMGFAEIDVDKACKDLTLKQCYNYCNSRAYLLSQDCEKIIVDLKEFREVMEDFP